ncbi:TPA: retention module-containing protein [Vibrio diabolicus]
MSTQTVPQNAIVNAVKGEVLVLGLDGKVRSIKAGDELISGEVIITENNASLDVQIHNELYLVDANCVACLPEPSFEQPETLLQSPVNGQVTFDPTAIEGANFDANDVAAIQQAILDGADPTAILEATAAGAGAEGSANAGYVTVEYNNPEVLASTFFETSATRSGVEERDEADDLDVTIFADGGQSLQSSVTEGSISLSSYPQTISSSVLVEAGDLALDTASFVPETSSLESLLTELNSDITSAGQPVAFVYDEAQNAIIGTQEGNEVLRIEIEATSLGRDLELEVVTTISQGIDHVASVADGQVSISGDQINIAFDITGADIGGNSIQAPIDFTTTVIDGDDPAPQNVTFENVESSSTPITGTFVDIGSDQLATVTFNQEGLSQFDGLLSDNQATEAVLSEDGSTITLSIAGSNETVLTINLNTDGTYQFEQFKPLEQTNGEDTIKLSLPTTIVDFDQDTASNTFTLTILDGDNPVIENVTGLSLDEAGVDQGSQEGAVVTSGTGSITTAVGSDIIDHYELEPTEFNVGGELQSQRQVVQLELASESNGVRTYEGFIELDGVRITVFDVAIDVPVLGEYQFNLYEQLDHTGANDDSLTFSLPVYAVDADGDRSSITEGSNTPEAAQIVIQVQDDVPSIDGVDALAVDEDDLSSVGSDQSQPTLVEGQFTTTQGSDRVVSYQLESGTDPLNGLESQGRSISLTETANSDGSFTYSATAEGDAIFTLQVNPDGSYSFSLEGPIDHAVGSDSLTLDFTIVATDFDGDTSSLVLPVTIADDVPTINDVVALTVDEDDLSSVGSDQSQPTLVEGQFTTTQGSDGVVQYQLDVNADPLNGLQSQGQTVSIAETQNADGSYTYSATANGSAVFTLILNTDGSYSFELEGPIDHAADSDSLTLDFSVIATDFDGDTSQILLPVTIVDDKPTITDVDAITVDEDDLATIGSDQTDPIPIDGNFTTTQGSDRVVSYQLDASATPVDGLTSQGVAVTLTETANGDGSFTYQATAGTESVFTLTVNTDGSYNFTLEGPIDHAVDSDELTLNFPIIATDFDGDTTNATIPVTIVDDKPVITDVDAITVDEDDLASIGSDQSNPISIDGSFITTQGSDRVVSYQLDASSTPVDGLTSQGVAVTLTETANGDGSFTYEATAGSEAIFTLTVNTDGTYNFTLERPIDHAVDSDELTLNFPIIATDFDGDTVTEIIPVTIVDDVPTITAVDALSVDEDDLSGVGSDPGGDLFVEGAFTTTQGSDRVVSYQLDSTADPVAGLTSQGEAITLVETANGDGSFTYVATADGNPVFTLNVATDGTYDFTLQGPIDHAVNSDSLTIDFPIVATDFDGDTTSATIPVTITDDAPIIDNVVPLAVDEDDLIGSDQTDAVFVEGAFTTTQGSDRVVSYQLDSTSDPVAGLTSQGEPVTLVETANADGSFTYVATADGDPVFTMNVNADGTYNFRLEGPVDHALNSDELVLNFPIIATDFDGDTTTATIPVTITDDVPTIDNVVPLTVDEDDLASIGSDQNDDAFMSGSFTTTEGSDSVVKYQLDATANPVAGLTSHGEPVVLAETANGDGSFTYTATADGNAVFELVVKPDGSYTFTLQGPLDHSVNSDSLQIDFPIIATDFDGDTSAETLPVTIVDDKPTITDVDAIRVDEDDLATIGSDGSDPISIDGNFTTTQGSDGVVSYQLDAAATPVDGLTSQGVAVTLTETANGDGSYTYEATAGTEAVFTLTVNTDGSYNFTLQGPIDHATDSDELTLNFPIIATDFDGDTTTETIPVTIVDDKPTIADVDAITVDEDDLGTIGSDQTGPISIDGNFTTTQGSDRVVSYQLDASATPVAGLTSQGVAVTLTETANADGSFTYEATAGTEAVFTLTVNTDGSYNFTLEGPIDHAVDSDELTLNFPIIATDFDGDTSAETIPVKIVDDKPTLGGIEATSVQTVDEDDIPTVGSDGTQSNSIAGNFIATDGSDGILEYSVSDLTTPVQGLTSGGQSLVMVEVSNAGGVSVYEARIDGTTTPVFRVTLDASDDSYTFDLLAPLDHPNADGQNELVINLPINATDFDGDVSNNITLPITVVDDVPTIDGLLAGSEQTVDEDDLPAGTDAASAEDTVISGTFDITEGADQVASIQLSDLTTPVASLTSDGEAITLVLSSSANGVNVYQGVAGNPAEVVFELTLDATNNSYEFDLQKPLDHPDGNQQNEIVINLPVTATDNDGDTSPAFTLPITVVDDVPVVTNIESLRVDEDDLPLGSDGTKEPLTVSGEFEVTSADGIDAFELDLSSNPIPNLKSGGEEVTLSQDVGASTADARVYVGQTPGGVTVFTLTLHQDGKYDFELSGQLDHAVNSDEILLNLPVKITDGDNDIITATLPVTIVDDKPTIDAISSGSTLSVDEDDIPSQGSDDTPESNIIGGNFDVTDGADSIVSFQLDSLTSPVSGLTSGGQPLELVEFSNSNGVIEYRAYVQGTTDTVFKLTLNGSADSYEFELLGALDHPAGNDENSLVINFPVNATDFDGDVSNNITLPITVVDDVPAIVKVTDSSQQTVDEDDLSGGSDTTSNDSTVLNGGFEVVAGADKIVSYQVSDLDAVVSGLTSNGSSIELNLVGTNGGVTSYEAVITGTSTKIFTLSLDANNDSYQFELLGPIDHDAVQGENNLVIDIPITVTDFDGDTSSSLNLPITVVDDIPEIKSADALAVDEDDLANGSQAANKDSLEATGNFDTVEGADTVVSYQLDLTSNPIPGVTSGGLAVTLVQTAVSNNNFTYQGQTPDGNSVFTLVLNADGSYKFTLEGALDHSTQGEDTLILDLPVFATDVDGDTAGINLPVTITDDVPTLHDASISRVEGQGSRTVRLFRDPVEGDDDLGADGAQVTSFSADDSGIYFKQNGVDSDSVDLNGSNQVVFVHKVLDGVDTEIGRLVVRTDGSVSFRPNDDLDHTETDSIDFTINVVATDGDGDIADADVDISIRDRNAQIDTSTVTAFEDQGRDGVVVGVDSANTQDNLSTLDVSPAKVDLVINLHDIDRNESLGDITIRDADTHNGTFYYRDGSGNYIELTSVGNTVVLDASNVEQSFNGELVSLDNLYFVPDRHTSTDASGIDPRIRVEILNNGTPDHTINGRLDIEVAAVADIATWTANSEFHYSVDEDGNNVALNITAETQDTSNPEGIVFELVFTQGEGNAELVYSDGSAIPKSGGVYLVDASRIDEVQVDPIDNFSGEIRIDVTAITTENNNPLLGKDTARSETETIIIDVNPVADKGSFTVNRINVFEDNARTQNTVDPVTDHDPLQLSEVITMKPSADLDGSEALFVRISNFSIDGVTLVWLDSANPSQIVEVTDSGGNILYYEVPESELANVEVLPPLHSNDDFTFNVEGIVKDTASLSTGTTEDVLSLGSKTVIVGVKGVADIPDTVLIDAGNVWNRFVDGDVAGIETTIEENGVVNLNFSVVSGEVADRPLDDSEAITVILSNIPDGVRVVDSDGSSVDLTFVGYDGNGQPIYEANITGLNFNSGIQIIPEASSTENIAITGTIIVTENDGHSRVIEREVRIKVEPVIDAQDNYVVRSEGDEDTRFDIDWKPTLVQSPDTDEFFSDVTISGFPPGSTVYVDGVAQTLVSGTLTLSPQAGESEQDFSAKISQSGYVQVQLEQDSSTDFDLTTTVTVKEIDHEYVDASNPGEGIAEKTINGTVNVQVNPIVEPEDKTGAIDDQTRLLVTENGGGATDIVKSDDQGNIDFTINTSMGGESGAHIIKYQEFDASSDEVVTQLVVQFHNVDPEILNQLVIVGALNEGGGRWTVTNEDNFSIKAPSGLDLTPNDDSDDGDNGGLSQIGLTIYAEVNDLGEDLGNEKDATVMRQTDVTLEFPTVLTPQMSVAAEIQVADDVQIQALEDNSINLGAQLTSKVDAINADGVEDVLTIIVDPSAPGIPPGLVITGTDIDFVNGKYVFQAHIDASGNITGLDGLTMHLAEDYAGDFELPIRFVTKDTESGDEKENNVQFPVQVLPVADVPSSAGDQPLDSDVTPNVKVDIVGTFGLDANKQPVTDLNNDVPTADGVGYEDGLIQLNLSVDFADQFNNTQGGRETLTNIKLELDDTTLGEFVDANGNSLGTSIEFNEAEILAGALDNVLFKPKENYPVGGGQNTVKINIEGEITDEAVFDQSILNNSGDNIDVRTFTDDVTFEVTPVVDDITITGADPTQPITVIGDEDTLISLNQSGSGVSISLNDNDGSESFVSLKLTGIPDDFVVQSNSSDYVVKNNGGGEWSIQLKDLTQTSVDLSDIQIKPPKNFSGEAEIGITVFIQEELLQVPTERTNNFTLVVNPIGDDVDVNPDTSAAGNEGEDIVINVNALVVDNKESIGDGATYQENDPETLRVEISNVPDGASVSLPDGTVFTDQGNGVFVLEIDAQDLDQVVFNSGDRNDNSWGGSLHFKVQAVDTGLDGRQSLGSAEEFDVAVDVEAVNDRPEFANVIDVETPEDNAILLDTFGISDVDAVLDDPTAEYVLNIAVDSGYLVLNPSIIANYGLTVSGDGTGSIELKGTVSDLNPAIADGLVEFNPALNFFGNVNVDISVDDQGNEGIVISGVDETLNSNSSQFVIEVTEVNDAPTTSEVTLTSIDEDSGAVIMTAADLLVNAVDIESDNLTVSNVTLVDPAAGTLTQLSSTEWSFEPAPDFYGDVSFNYDITDDGMTNGVSDPKTVSGSAVMTVQAINDAPEIDGSMVTNTIVESSDQKISGIEITDVDFAGVHENEIMTVSLSIDEGDISVVVPAGSGITQGVGLAGETVLMGTLSQLNSLFASTDPDVGVFIDASDVNSNSIALTVTADDNGIFYDNLTGTSLQTSETFDINVTPVADVPNLAIDQSFSYIQRISASQSASRQGIALVGIMAALTDVDEVLALELTGVPRGATITSEATTSNISFDGTTWTVPEDEIDTLHINNAIPGDYDITLTAVSTASNGDQAYSTPLDINLNVTLNSQDIDQSAESEDSYLIGSDAGITLAAGTGDDYILGGDGDDVLIGGLGSDILTGGAGSDIFKWTEDTVDNGAIDTITDFSVNEDTIDLKDVIADLNDPTAGIDDLLAHIQADYDASTENVSLNITTDANVQQTIVVENLGTSIDFNGLSSNEIVESLLNHGVIDNG